MAKLNKEEIKELDKFIDQNIVSQPLLKRPREVALINLLRLFEDYVRFGAKGNRDIIKLGIDGMKFAIQWIYEYCEPLENKKDFKTKDNVYDETHKLLMSAKEYSVVWDILTLLHREQLQGEREGDTVIVNPINQFTPAQDVADQFISSPDTPEMKQAQELGKYKEEILSRTHNITYQSKVEAKIKYTFTDEVFKNLKEYLLDITKPLWELNPDWDLGGYTFGEFRNFWMTLLSLTLINQSACINSGLRQGAINSTVIIKNKTRFIRELSRRSGLNEEKVSLILNDLIYNSEINKTGQKQADVSYQPIFLLAGDLIAISSYLTSNSNAERNMWDLLSIIKPAIHSRLSTLKENTWIQDLSQKLKNYGLKSVGPINFEHEGQRSDIDLLIYDEKNNFLVGTELKWLTPPDRTTEVHYVDQQLAKGMSQALLAKKWLETKPSKIMELLGVDKSTFEKTAIETMVLSKNSLGSSWLEYTSPVLNERLLDWILGDPHKKTLKALWLVGKEKRYLPIVGKHYEEPDVTVTFAGITFTTKGNFGLRTLQVWDAKDIDMKNL